MQCSETPKERSPQRKNKSRPTAAIDSDCNPYRYLPWLRPSCVDFTRVHEHQKNGSLPITGSEGSKSFGSSACVALCAGGDES